MVFGSYHPEACPSCNPHNPSGRDGVSRTELQAFEAPYTDIHMHRICSVFYYLEHAHRALGHTYRTPPAQEGIDPDLGNEADRVRKHQTGLPEERSTSLALILCISTPTGNDSRQLYGAIFRLIQKKDPPAISPVLIAPCCQ